MMRITNSMMTANTKANLNVNKSNSDTLNTMVASGQKITRPSDDPVVAIRAMRLNTSLTELNQYYGKNIPDASAWFTDTETALSQTDEVLTDIREKLNQASSEENVTSNVKDILEELKQLKAQFYAIGNADSAGRTVFTGYRTGEMLTFMDKDNIRYCIDEPFEISDLEIMDYVKGTSSVDKDGNFLESSYDEQDVENVKTYRMRLSYGNISDADTGVVTLNYKNASGVQQPATTLPIVELSGKTQAQIDALYTGNGGAGCVIKETGEVILPKANYDDLIQAKDITISYEKREWEKGDPRPEHYFKCNTPKDPSDPRTYSPTYPTGVEYNFNRLDSYGNPTTLPGETIGMPPTYVAYEPTGFKEQELTYEISFNQSIQINIHANDVYSHDIGRDIDDLIRITEQLANTETKISTIESAIALETDPANIETLNKTLAAANKERTLYKEKMHNMYTAAITSFKGYSDDVNKQIAGVGALTARLDMTKNRVKDQQTNVKKLADENINADLTETSLDFKNAQLALEAAQMAAGKIANQTLLNYI